MEEHENKTEFSEREEIFIYLVHWMMSNKMSLQDTRVSVNTFENGVLKRSSKNITYLT